MHCASFANRSLRDALDRDLQTLLQADARECTAKLARKLGVARITSVVLSRKIDRT